MLLYVSYLPTYSTFFPTSLPLTLMTYLYNFVYYHPSLIYNEDVQLYFQPLCFFLMAYISMFFFYQFFKVGVGSKHSKLELSQDYPSFLDCLGIHFIFFGIAKTKITACLAENLNEALKHNSFII
jgi:hypothetical protein